MFFVPLTPVWLMLLRCAGGWVVWSTFLEGEHNPAPPYRPSRRLQEGELRGMFSDDKGFEVLHDSLGETVTHLL